MLRYEVLILAVPTITQDEAKSIETGIDSLDTTGSCTIVSFERWGKYRLAYPVKGFEYGVYYLVRAEINPKEGENKFDFPEAIKSLCRVKYHEFIMRHVVTALDATKSMVYQRPLSLEDEPVKEKDEFSGKNKSDRMDRGYSKSDEFHSKSNFNLDLDEDVTFEG